MWGICTVCVRYRVEVKVNLEVEGVKDNQICESENKVQKPWAVEGPGDSQRNNLFLKGCKADKVRYHRA